MQTPRLVIEVIEQGVKMMSLAFEMSGMRANNIDA